MCSRCAMSPLLVKSMLEHCVNSNIDEAYKIIEQLWALGYSPEDIIGNIFRVCKTFQMSRVSQVEVHQGGRIHPREGGGGQELPTADGRPPGSTVQQDGHP